MTPASILLETDTTLSMDLVGWGSLVLGVLVTVIWMAYLYR